MDGTIYDSTTNRSPVKTILLNKMFVYDSACDEYKEVLESDLDDTNEATGQPASSLALIARRPSSRSVRSPKHSSFVPRIISKAGRLNTILSKLPHKHLVYFRDFGNTLLGIQWRWILITVCLVNFATFLVFGLAWQWIAMVSGDFDKNATDLCVVNVKDFTGYVLLSAETIMTIGYGFRYPTEKCQQVWIVQGLQAFVSVAIQGALISAVYVKISKPFTKNSLALFSKRAVICLRDGKLCLIIRIIDLVGKVSIGTTVTMYFVDKDVVDCDTESLSLLQINVLPLGFLIFPEEIVHEIDHRSPLWTVTPFQLLRKRFEIIAVVEGTSTVTGQPSQHRTSYINSDILWGHRFSPCVEFNHAKMKYAVNYKQVNRTDPFDTPLCSGEELNRIAIALCDHDPDPNLSKNPE